MASSPSPFIATTSKPDSPRNVLRRRLTSSLYDGGAHARGFQSGGLADIAEQLLVERGAAIERELGAEQVDRRRTLLLEFDCGWNDLVDDRVVACWSHRLKTKADDRKT